MCVNAIRSVSVSVFGWVGLGCTLCAQDPPPPPSCIMRSKVECSPFTFTTKNQSPRSKHWALGTGHWAPRSWTLIGYPSTVRPDRQTKLHVLYLKLNEWIHLSDHQCNASIKPSIIEHRSHHKSHHLRATRPCIRIHKAVRSQKSQKTSRWILLLYKYL